MLELLAFIIGAFVALYAYSWGRNNEAPKPTFSIPFLSPKREENGKPTQEKTHSRGM